jgi:uncharacterized protein YndB with AHSA1/START domain
MAVTLSVSTITIEPAPEHVYPKRNTAIITVDVTWGNKQAMQMNFSVGDYDDISAAIEKVNDQLIVFADEMSKAAHQPLSGTRRNA